MRVGTVQAEMPEVWGAGGARFEPLPSRPEAETGDPPLLPTADGETVVPTSPLPPSAPCSHPTTPSLLCRVEETTFRATGIELDLQCLEDVRGLQNQGSPG